MREPPDRAPGWTRKPWVPICGVSNPRAVGGLGQVRGFLEEITLSDYLRAERAAVAWGVGRQCGRDR